MRTITLIEAYKRSQKDELDEFSKFKDAKERPFSLLSFGEINETYFLYTAFEEHDYQRSKTYLYKVALTYSYYCEIYRRNIFATMNGFTFPILSDSSEIIERYLKYPYPGMEPGVVYAKDGFSTHFAQAIQSVLENKDDDLQMHIEGLCKGSKRGWEKLYAGLGTAFEGLLLKDKELIEQGIYELLKTHMKQDPLTIDSNYINYEATTIAKLAYRKGIEVQIDSPLVPPELLPIKELNEYEGYDLFDEFAS